MPNRIGVVADLIRRYGCTSYAEIGVKQGRMFAGVLKQCPQIQHAIAVDPWEDVPNGGEDYSTWDYAEIYQEFERNIEPFHNRRLQVLKMLSTDAAELVDAVDLVFIDAGHDYQNCRADILAWAPKCNKVLAGHDYTDKWPGVMQAVDELVADRQIIEYPPNRTPGRGIWVQPMPQLVVQ